MFIFFETVIFLLIVYYFVHKISSKEVPLYLKILVFLCWSMSFVIIIVLPLDIYYSQLEDEQTNRYIRMIWITLYWGISLLAWVLLPISQDYEASGYFTHKDKLKDSYQRLVSFYKWISLPLGLLAVMYLYYYKPNMTEIKALFKTLTNCQQLLQINKLILKWDRIDYFIDGIWICSGSQNADQENVLKIILEIYIFLKNISIFKQAKQKLRDYKLIMNLKLLLIQLNYVMNMQFKKELQNKFKFQNKQFNLQFKYQKIPPQIIQNSKIHKENIYHKVKQIIDSNDISQLFELSREIKQILQNVRSIEFKQEEHISKTLILQDIIKSKNDKQKIIKSVFFNPQQGYFSNIINYATWIWYTQINQFFFMFLACIISLISFFIFIAEITIFMNLKLSVFGIILQTYKGFYEIQIFTLVPLLFLWYIINYGIFRLQIAGYSALNYPNQTDSASLIFASMYYFDIKQLYKSGISIKLQFFKYDCNFKYQLLKSLIQQFKVFGDINQFYVLGSSFNLGFPCLLIVLVTFNYYDFQSRFLQMIGMNQFEFRRNFNSIEIEEGRQLVNKERQAKESLIDQSSQFKRKRGFIKNVRLLSSLDQNTEFYFDRQSHIQNYSPPKLQL